MVKLSPAIKQGIYYAILEFIIVSFVASFAIYAGIVNIPQLRSYSAGFVGIALGAVVAIFAFILGFIIWHVTNWLARQLKTSKKAIIQGVIFGILPLIALNIIGAITGFIIGYLLWWLSNK